MFWLQGWGKVIVLGLDKPEARLSLNCSEVLHDGKTLQGNLFGGLKPKSHVSVLLKRYMDKVLFAFSFKSFIFGLCSCTLYYDICSMKC
jgi:Zn-dependent alcohol dehydrogenase